MTEEWKHPQEGEVIVIQKISDNQWEMKMACCDCGLAHIFSFKMINDNLGLKIFSDNKSTKKIRKQNETKY